MRILCCIGVAVALGALASPATAAVLDYQGLAFETGGFPPSDTGDELRMPLVVTAIDSVLGFDPAAEEITGWVSGLVSTGTQDVGDGVLLTSYGPGRIEFYRDPSRDRDFGTSPPNATVPGTFQNGSLCLAGDLTSFVLYFDTETRTGAYQGQVVFDTGSCLADLSAERLEGFTFGGALAPQVVGSTAVPEGYDLQVDGYLEAKEVTPPEGCEFACIGIESARLDFPRHRRDKFGPKDGKFCIEGNFLPCDDGSELDPGDVEVRVRIGDYQQVFPAGALRRHGGKDDGDDDRDDDARLGGREVEWEFENERGTRTITELEIEDEGDGHWEFEISGRGIERSILLPDDNVLEVEICIGSSSGTAEAPLVQKKSRLRFKSKDEPCEPEGDRHELPRSPEPPAVASAAAAQLLPASPNPFNATTTIGLRTLASGDVRLRIFDVRGRLVRELQGGALSAGEHRFVWRGDDDQGQAVASGVYVYRLDAPGVAEARKLVVAK
jgi:hypothetical protein